MESNNNMIEYPPNLIERFWKYVNKKSENECWEWKGSLTKRGGYGQLRFKYKTLKTHRVSYEIHFKKIDSNKIICHKCGNSKCCNPFHLYEGTYKDNHNDSIKHGTAYIFKIKKHNEIHTAKINIDIAKEIRESNENGVILGKRYGISKTMISKIKRNLSWKN